MIAAGDNTYLSAMDHEECREGVAPEFRDHIVKGVTDFGNFDGQIPKMVLCTIVNTSFSFTSVVNQLIDSSMVIVPQTADKTLIQLFKVVQLEPKWKTD